MSIRSGGHIRAQSRKLSEIASIFARFLPSQILMGEIFRNFCPLLSLSLCVASPGKVSWGYSLYFQSYRQLTRWILSRIYNVCPKKILGDPRPGLWCALASLAQTLVRVKISRANTAKEQSSRPPSSYLPNQHTPPYNFVLAVTVFPLLKNNPVTMTNFINRMLFYDIYWLNYFLAWPPISLFHCAACHMWLLKGYYVTSTRAEI